MKGTEKIIAHIQADAKAQADAILAQAEQQCAGIREDYEKKAEEAYGRKIREGVKACEDIAESKNRIAHMESKKDILALKQEMVAESFTKARSMILSMPEDKYRDFLVKLAVRSSSSGDEKIVLNVADRAKYGEYVVRAANEKLGNGNLGLADEPADFEGGLILRRGAVEINNTLDLLVELCRGEMSAEVAKLLFE